MSFADAGTAPRVPGRTWTIIVLLGLSGQIAWNVENTWFATFVYDTITPDSRPIAAMTAISAAVATATTLGVGAWSDRLGRRSGSRRSGSGRTRRRRCSGDAACWIRTGHGRHD